MSCGGGGSRNRECEVTSFRRAVAEATPDDLVVLDNGLAFADGEDRLEYLWFHLLEREDGREYNIWRVVVLRTLRYLPQEARQEAGLVERMRTALTGLYNQRRAEYDLAELKAGIFDPPLGLLQMYGAIGLGTDLDGARRNALLGMAAVRGAMANFEQSRLEPLTVQLAEWMRRALSEFPHALVVIGQPEPRLGARGMGREGPGEVGRGQVQADGRRSVSTQQQGEMLCRALAAMQEEFLMVTLASRMTQPDLARMLAGVAAEASVPASQMSGVEAISTGIAIPFTLSESLGRSVASAFGRAEGQAVSDGVADSETTSHVTSHATTVGHASTRGIAHTSGVAHTSGGSSSRSVTITKGSGQSHGTAHTDGSATTAGSASTHSSFSSVGSSWGSNWGVSGTHGGATVRGQAHGVMSGDAHGVTTGAGTADTTSHADMSGGSRSTTTGVGDTIGMTAGGSMGSSATIGEGVIPAGLRGGATIDGHISGSASVHTDRSLGTNWSSTDGAAHTASSFDSTSNVHTEGENDVTSSAASNNWSVTRSYGGFSGGSSSSGSSSSVTRSQAQTRSQADTVSQAQTTNRSVSRTSGSSSFASSTVSSSTTVSEAETDSWARTDSVADGIAHGHSRSHGVSRSSGTNVGRSLGVMRGSGFGVAAMPSFGLSRSYQWWNDPAVQLTQIMRAQEELLRQATLEGGWLTDVYVLTRSEEGAAAAEAAVRQAYHGSGPLVVTPVQTRRLSGEEEAYIRRHAMAFTPSTREERVAGTLEAYRDSSLLLPLQLAAYTAPVLFEEGLSVTTQERIPAFAFVPDMPGDAVLGHLWSTERAELTAAQLRLSPERFFHTVFAADTGFGKTVAAERLVVETTRMWHYRTVVLDFGAGWRRLLNAPLGEPGRVEVWQLFPGATVPFRWNPWQVGKRIQPERQLVATCEIFKNAGRMGARQLGFMRRAARQLYLENGVLVTDREVLSNPAWNRVRGEAEEEAVNAARQERGLTEESRAGMYLEDLEGFERQALAVHRSKAVDMTAWVERLASFKRGLERKRDQASLQSLEGALLRLEVFTQGETARMYGSGEGAVAVEELGLLGPPGRRWGISILEGGAELDEYAKAAILGLVAWHLYNDAVVRRRQDIGKARGPVLQIVFEEANKVLTGVQTEGEERSGAATTTELFQTMWRDGRKYHIFLHPVVQTVSELPAGILSSCNNGFFGQTKNPRDRDLIMSHLAFSEKGFTDEDYKRFISRMPQAMAVCKLGYSQDVVHTTPFLCRPVMVTADEPTDDEILARRRALGRGR